MIRENLAEYDRVVGTIAFGVACYIPTVTLHCICKNCRQTNSMVFRVAITIVPKELFVRYHYLSACSGGEHRS